jgi:hypothetical protein
VAERTQAPRLRGVVVLAVVAIVAATASIVVARTGLIHPDTTPAQASSRPPLVLQGTLTTSVPWAGIRTTGSYDGRGDPDNRHEELQALYRGEPLSELVGLVDDDDPDTFNETRAREGYAVKLSATDGYTWTVDSRTIIGEDGWIVASLRDGRPLPEWEGPYRLVGDEFIGFRAGQAVKLLTRIELVPGHVESQTPQ